MDNMRQLSVIGYVTDQSTTDGDTLDLVSLRLHWVYNQLVDDFIWNYEHLSIMIHE